MNPPTTERTPLTDAQDLVRQPFRSALYSGNARAVFERGIRSQWQGNLGVMISGFLEPVLFLLAMGLGLGALIGTITDDAGRMVDYPVYIAPALLATSAMNGAVYDSTWGVFFKLKISKIYSGVLSTTVGPMDVALGEIAVALVRGGVYALGFVAVMGALGLISSWWAVLMVPACLLIAFGFAALGMAATSYLRTFQQMDWLTLGLMPMFLFSATFYPLSVYPEAVQWFIMALPLWHGVEMLRALNGGWVDWSTAGHALYFVVLALVGTWAASLRLKALFLR
ncbi:MAG: ABC transporter permease [Arachnia sp.]